MATAVAQRDSFPTGIAASIGIHLLIVAYIVISFSQAQPLQPPSDLSKAIPISLELFRPTPPPQPPKPIVEPKPPKDIVTTTAPDPEAEIAKAPEEPPSPPSPPPEPATGNPSTPTYASLVAGILERNKHYPTEARRDLIEGVVDSYFVVNAQGHVIGYRIEKSSGFPMLDQEVVRLLKYVRFPPIPDDGGDPQRREFRLPLAFKMAAS